MAIRRTALVSGVIVLSLGVAVPAIAQGKKPKPASYPGFADFRCNGLERTEDPPCADPDRLKGDGSRYPGLGAPEGGEGAHLRLNAGNTNLEMWIGLRNGRQVYIDFVAQPANAPCHTAPGGCVYPSAFGSDDIMIGSTYAEIQSSVVNDLDPTNTAATLLDIPHNVTWDVRLLIGFNDTSGRLWNFNFSTLRSNGSSSLAGNARVTRLDLCKWRFDDGGRAAELSTLVRVSGKQFRSFEGVYYTPFQIDFEAAGCPATSFP